MYYNLKSEFLLNYDKCNMFIEEATRCENESKLHKLWKLLVDKKMSKADLRKAVDIAPNTLTKMRKDGEVSMSVLLKIATYLDCDISDICEFVKDKE
mgnify:CR=1 FL=1